MNGEWPDADEEEATAWTVPSAKKQGRSRRPSMAATAGTGRTVASKR